MVVPFLLHSVNGAVFHQGYHHRPRTLQVHRRARGASSASSRSAETFVIIGGDIDLSIP